MRFYEWLTLGYFATFAVLAWKRRLPSRARLLITAINAAAAALILTSGTAPGVLRDSLPLVLIPICYWQTGQFVLPVNQNFQLKLQKFDQKFLRAFLSWPMGGPWTGFTMSILELAYLMCYPMVPCGLVALYWTGNDRFATEFWNIVLPPACACYATFPFIQTLPPRAIERAVAWQRSETKLRTFNLLVLRHVSIQANTFPSGHVAASLAVALELIRLSRAVGLAFLCLAIGIGAGAFMGRYHYGLDVLIGAAIAVIAFLIVTA